MELSEALRRARGQLGLGAIYRLGGGSTNPRSSTCLDEGHGCDCSALVAWVLKLPKWQRDEIWYLDELNDGWLNTDGIWLDAHRRFGYFEKLEGPVPGCVVVYPGHKGRMGLPEAPGPKIGHVGIVTAVKVKALHRETRVGAGLHPREIDFMGTKIKRTAATKVVHCSSGNFRGWGDAIQETGLAVWTKRKATIYAWPSSVRPEVPENLRVE